MRAKQVDGSAVRCACLSGVSLSAVCARLLNRIDEQSRRRRELDMLERKTKFGKLKTY